MPSLDAITNLWEYTQAGTHGRYSSERALELTNYVKNARLLRTFAVIVGTPLPCLLVTVLVDIVKLDDPLDGLRGNTTFIAREYASYWLLSFLGAQQFRNSVPILHYPNTLILLNTFVVAAVSVGVLYGFALVIGFPVPFTIILGCSGWMTSLSASIAIVWMKAFRQNPAAWKMVLNVCKEWLCQLLLAIIYPVYFYVFTTLSRPEQFLFSFLLPVIKVFARSAFTRTVVHLRDEMPEVVIFNAEVFNALFVSYCMQNSPSIWTTLLLMTADGIQMAFSLRKLNSAHHGLEVLAHQVDQESSWTDRLSSNIRQSVTGQVSTHLDKAQLLISVHELRPVSTAISRSNCISPSRESPIAKIVNTKRRAKIFWKSSRVVPSSRSRNSPILVLQTPSSDRRLLSTVVRNGSEQSNTTSKLSIAMQYTQEVRRILYMSEIVLLHNYVEVENSLIPLTVSGTAIVAIYLVIMYHLPNRDYYAQLAGIEQRELYHTLKNVLLYCALQAISFVATVLMLQRKLGLSPIHQLAFVLEKQFAGIQIKLVFWVFYNVQASLKHYGFDYTFQFEWLHPTLQSSNSN